jgi:hypothetical protein
VSIFKLIVVIRSGDVKIKTQWNSSKLLCRLPAHLGYQLLQIGTPEREPEKRLPHPRKIALAEPGSSYQSFSIVVFIRRSCREVPIFSAQKTGQ